MSQPNSITVARVGDVFGRLTVIGYGERTRSKQLLRVCRCACGAKVSVRPGSLRCGETRSCGCLERDTLAAHNAARKERSVALGGHERGQPRTYSTWRAMRFRCLNPNSKDYPQYGGRGIRVCERWADSFDAFLEDMGPRPAGTTLDRIDTNGHYEPGNCRWATPRRQNNNRRNNTLVTRAGITKTLSEWVAEAGLPYGTVIARLRYKWGIERALTEPLQKHTPRKRPGACATKSA